MHIRWTEQALESFNHMYSEYFSLQETKEYKKTLVKRIEEKITLLGTSMPADEEEWEGSYKIIIDKYLVYYSFLEDQKTCYIEYLSIPDKEDSSKTLFLQVQ